MIERQIRKELLRSADEYPIVTLTGPRQSGKTTILKSAFPDYDFVSLEDMDMRQLASEDPRGFLERYPDRTIIDEIQRVPSLLSYLQTHTDNEGRNGMYILSGSQNLALLSAVDQSLAGRTAVLRLLPLSHSEMLAAGIIPASADEEIFRGGYPRIYDKKIRPSRYYSNYFETYVERDIRSIQKIADLDRFIRFTCLCAGRIGQMLNMSSLATECGISAAAAGDWISVLRACYVVYLLKPDYRNYSKRLVKTPKLYFHDTGLACSLLEITDSSMIRNHYMRGKLFENLVVNEFLKSGYNSGAMPRLSFWRDSNGVEVDLIDTINGMPNAVEVKSGKTYSDDFFSNLRKWRLYSGSSPDVCSVIYDGDADLQTKEGHLVSWRGLHLGGAAL